MTNRTNDIGTGTATQDQAVNVNSAAAETLALDQNEHTRGPTLVEKFVIRLPMGLRDQIKQLSEHNRRSMNSEIIMVLEGYIKQQLVQQMTDANEDGNFQVGLRQPEADFVRVLENLPKEKKAALIELLG